MDILMSAPLQMNGLTFFPVGLYPDLLLKQGQRTGLLGLHTHMQHAQQMLTGNRVIHWQASCWMNPDLLKTNMTGRLTLEGGDLVGRFSLDLLTFCLWVSSVCTLWEYNTSSVCVCLDILRLLTQCFSQIKMHLFVVRNANNDDGFVSCFSPLYCSPIYQPW